MKQTNPMFEYLGKKAIFDFAASNQFTPFALFSSAAHTSSSTFNLNMPIAGLSSNRTILFSKDHDIIIRPRSIFFMNNIIINICEQTSL